MELVEFLIFISVNIVLLVITLTRHGAFFSLIGMTACLFFIPYELSSGVILDRVYVTNSTGIIQTQNVYANATVILMTMFILTFAHIIAIMRSVKSE